MAQCRFGSTPIWPSVRFLKPSRRSMPSPGLPRSPGSSNRSAEPTWRVSAMLRQRCAVPIMADESLQSLHDAYDVARAEAADVFNVYISEAGGILAAKQIFDFASALDIPCIIGSQAELGIGTAAAAHLGVAVSNLPYPCETFGTAPL